MHGLRGKAFVLAVLAGAALAWGCSVHEGARDSKPRGPTPAPAHTNPFEPSAEERRMAVDLAERAIAERELRGEGPMVLVGVSVERDKEREVAGEPARLLFVTHYRYAGDLTIISVVDASSRRVIDVESTAHLPVALAEEELERAKSLAIEDPRVRERLGADRTAITAIEPMVLTVPGEDDPLYGHRVVRLLFKTARGYLRDPIVHVDLTTGEVLLTSPGGEDDETYR